MVIISVYLCLFNVSNLIFQTAFLVYKELAQFASMSDKRASIIELHRAGKTNLEIINLL